MSRALVTRRLTALTAATALLSAAGLASGGLASAAPGDPTSATSVSPSAVSNSSATATTLTVRGAGFNMLTNTVTLKPTILGAVEVKNITGTVDKQNSSATALIFTAPLTGVAPEPYDVVVATSSSPGAATVTCVKCLTITNPGRPTVTGVAGTGGGSISISGTNFAIGAKVSFLKPDLTVDPDLTFYAGSDSGSTHTSGYVGTTKINGRTSHGANVTAGKHYLKVTNLDSQGSTQFVEFWQPKLTTTAPLTLGQGATNIPVTVSGAGIRTGSSLALSQYADTNPITMQPRTTVDITVGTATVAGTFDSITAPVSVSDAGGAQARNVSVTGPDGGFDSHASLSVTVAPVPDGSPSGEVFTPLDISTFGQGAKDVQPVTVTGSDFKPGIVFGGGSGVTFTTLSVAGDGMSATVKVNVASDAPVGAVDVLTATNPDHGVGTYDGSVNAPLSESAFTIKAGPVVTGISPSGLAPNQSKTVTLTGTGFNTAASGMTLTSTDGLSFSNVVVGSATSATALATTTAGAAAGPRDVTVINGSDKGRYVCLGCLGVDSLTISPNAGANTQTGAGNGLDITFTATSGTLTGGTFVLHKTGAASHEFDITGTSPVIAGDGKTATAIFDLGLAAPGQYDATVTTPGASVSCTGCFTITGTDFTVAAVPVTSATGGRGATDFPITIHGGNFVRGEKVTIPGTTVSDTTYVSPTTLTALITIPQGATLGQVDVTVSAADGGFLHTVAKAYTIVAAPTVTSTKTTATDTKSIGQGATGQGIAIVGTGFTAGHATFSGVGLTGTTVQTDATHLAVTAAVAPDAPIGARDVTVTNTDNGGTSLPLVGAITITAKPVVSLVSPPKLVAGKSATVMITGQGFQIDSGLTIANVTFSGTSVSSDGTIITTTATALANAALGTRNVTVTNSDGGRGTCAACFTIVIPTKLTATLAPTVVSGQPTRESGTLYNPNTGAAIAGAGVTLTIVPKAGPTVTTTVVTSSTGAWTYVLRPTYNTTVTASFAGDGTRDAATSVARTITASTRVTVTSPAAGATTSAATPLVVRGGTSPNKAGRTIYLFKLLSDGHLQALTSATVAGNGTYALSARLGRGNYTLRVGTASDVYNFKGYSRPFTHHRV